MPGAISRSTSVAVKRVLAETARLIRESGRRIEERVEIVGAADCRRLVADHRRMAVGPALVCRERARVVVARVVVTSRGGIAIERELADQRNGRQRRGGREELSTGHTGFSHV